MRKLQRASLVSCLVAALVGLGGSAARAADIVYVGEDGGQVGVFGRDYQYTIVADPGGPPGPDWYTLGFDRSNWNVGETVFGNTGGIDVVPRRTFWAASSDVYAFKTFTLGQSVAMTMKTAVDNGYAVYLNDVLVAGNNAEGFTTHWEYIDAVGASFFHPGLNWIAFHLEDHGGSTAWDFALVGDDSGLRPIPAPSTFILMATSLAGFLMRRARKD